MNPLHDIERLFDTLLTVSWQAAILVLLILAVQFFLGKRLPSRWRYALWFLVLARLLLPVLPESKVSVHQYAPLPMARTLPETPALATPAEHSPATATIVATKPNANAARSNINIHQMLLGAWLAGVVLLGATTALSHLRFLRALRKTRTNVAPEIETLLASCAREMRVRRKVRVLETELVNSPAMIDLWRPTLLLPTGLAESFDREELRIIFLHEMAHLRRGDLWVETLMIPLQILHWFNPLLWLGFRRMRHDRELATDALVLSGTRVELKHLYGSTLIKLVENISLNSPLQPRLGMMENASSLKTRIIKIRQAVAGSYAWSALGIAAMLVIGTVTLTQAPKTILQAAVPEAKPALTTKTDTEIIPATKKYAFLAEGQKLTAEQAAQLEKKVTANPEDTESRTKLLGYYLTARRTQKDAYDAAQPHILWFINNRPSDIISGTSAARISKNINEQKYMEGVEAWERQLEKYPDEPKVLENAANYFMWSDNDRCEKLLLRTVELVPGYPYWPSQLSRFYHLKAKQEDAATAKQTYALALEFSEKALESNRGLRDFYLGSTALMAYRAGAFDKAQKYAEELMGMVPTLDDPEAGLALSIGNSVLGLVAFENGNIEAAKKYLLIVGETQGSPQLISAGPNMLLPQKLLDAGEKETVLKFLNKISKFWKGRNIVVNWKREIFEGTPVAFGNDYY